MKKLIFLRLSLVVLVASSMIFSSCVDECEDLTEFVEYHPVYVDNVEFQKPVEFEAARDIEVPGVINRYGQYLYINEYNQGVHVINNADPANPVREGFIAINNNRHFVINNGLMYANRYGDMVVIDIRQPGAAAEINRITEAFDTEVVIDDQGIITHYERTASIQSRPCHETSNGWWWGENGTLLVDNLAFSESTITASQSRNLSDGFFSGSSETSSTTRFTITEDKLFVLAMGQLTEYDLSNGSEPSVLSSQFLSINPETLYPFNEYLFVGGTNGMNIMDISQSPARHISTFDHANSCDPVVANEKYAYVTLRGGNRCNGFTNQLDIIDISNVFNPILIQSHPLTSPRGLTLLNDHVYVCDGSEGIKVFNVTRDNRGVRMEGYDALYAQDVLPVNEDVIVVSGNNGIYQLSVKDGEQPSLISIIN